MKKARLISKTEKAQSPDVGFLGISSIGPDVVDTDISDVEGSAREEGEEGTFIASDYLNGDIPSSEPNLNVPEEVSRLSSLVPGPKNVVVAKKNRGQD